MMMSDAETKIAQSDANRSPQNPHCQSRRLLLLMRGNSQGHEARRVLSRAADACSRLVSCPEYLERW
jgi:hypothetical protein